MVAAAKLHNFATNFYFLFCTVTHIYQGLETIMVIKVKHLFGLTEL